MDEQNEDQAPRDVKDDRARYARSVMAKVLYEKHWDAAILENIERIAKQVEAQHARVMASVAAAPKPPVLRIRLAAYSNPDFGQYGRMGIRPRWVKVASLAEASRVFREWVRQYNLGGGNCVRDCGEIRRAPKEVVARVSYNGRVWPPGPWKPGQKEMTDADMGGAA